MNRRNFLRSGAATGFLAGTGVLSTLTSGKAFAANTSGYKALVCIFLKGGMDHADTVIPRDQTSYDLLQNARPGLYVISRDYTRSTRPMPRVSDRACLACPSKCWGSRKSSRRANWPLSAMSGP
jgi:hypothetical protein